MPLGPQRACPTRQVRGGTGEVRRPSCTGLGMCSEFPALQAAPSPNSSSSAPEKLENGGNVYFPLVLGGGVGAARLRTNAQIQGAGLTAPKRPLRGVPPNPQGCSAQLPGKERGCCLDERHHPELGEGSGSLPALDSGPPQCCGAASAAFLALGPQDCPAWCGPGLARISKDRDGPAWKASGLGAEGATQPGESLLLEPHCI